MVGIAFYGMLTATEWTKTVEQKFHGSLMVVIVLQLMIFVNMVIILRWSFHNIKLLYIKYRARAIRYYHQRLKNKK